MGIVSWSDTTIVANVGGDVPLCRTTNTTYAARGTTNPNYNARCGELVITAANGKQSIDTVTIGGKAPTYVNGENATNNAIQSAIDAASPGDLIIVNGSFGPSATAPAGTTCKGVTTPTATCVPLAATYNAMLLMWKPVRLQGVGAVSTVVNANISPAGLLLEPWRRKVNCLFGLALNGGVIDNTIDPATGAPKNAYDPSSTYTCPSTQQGQVDRVQGEGVVGWNASLNGNLAELLQEPSLMGAYEGAAITVLGQGVRVPAGTTDLFGNGSEAAFPAGTMVLTNSAQDCTFGGNFLCAPSRIDGMSFTNSSQGGGGIRVHGWNHFIEVTNNRVYNNGGTLSGGMTIGFPEVPDSVDGRVDGTTLIDANGTEQPYLLNMNVSVHNNSVTFNASYGDELGSNTPASAGGVTICTGADYYKFNYNWVCGNLSSGNGGGFAHFGFSWNGDIEHNWFIFNQSINPTLTTYGGGAVIEGQGPDGFVNVNGVLTECGTTVDIDCPPGLSDGIGPGLVINGNVFQGNTAEEGSGGGLELQHVNGTDVQRNPSNPNAWYAVTVTGNIFADNVAGWDGGGISLHDAVLVNFSNNTVASNDSTASAGVLFDTTGAPNANQPPPGCDPNATPPPAACTNTSVTTSNFEPAGLATERHTATFLQAFTDPNVVCPAGHSHCTTFSNPRLDNDVFWQNRSFRITASTAITSGGPVQLVPALSQTATGSCPSGANYWDIGVYGDTSATNHSSGLTLAPTHSILSAGGYSGNSSARPGFAGQYCNGSRVPAEIAPQLCTGPNANANAPGCIQPGTVGLSMTVPGGVPDSVPPPLPAFTLTPAATVDEGSNWINMFYGPLSWSNPTVAHTSGTPQTPLGNYNRTAPPGAVLPAPYPNP